MAEDSKFRRLWRWFAPNPIWDVVKWIGGSTVMSSFAHFCWLEFHRSRVDWWWLASLIVVGAFLTVLGTWREREYSQKVIATDGPSSDVQPELTVQEVARAFTNAHNHREYVLAGSRCWRYSRLFRWRRSLWCTV